MSACYTPAFRLRVDRGHEQQMMQFFSERKLTTHIAGQAMNFVNITTQ